MSKNIRKFSSHDEYELYKALDGWDYPSVCFVDGNMEDAIHFDNEFIMRWNTESGVKVPEFSGSITRDEFKKKIKENFWKCEVRKGEKTILYPTNSGELHKEDKGYLQMVEVGNINVGFFQDTTRKIKEVRFNFDAGCPKGFYKWFPNATWKPDKKKWTKLLGRFDITKSTNPNDLLMTYNESLGDTTWSAKELVDVVKNTNTALDYTGESGKPKLHLMTYWEYVVLLYIMCAYVETFDLSKVCAGFNKSIDIAKTYKNGSLDELAVDGFAFSDVDDSAYCFMGIDNPLHGLRNLFLTGLVCFKQGSYDPAYYLSFDESASMDLLGLPDEELKGKGDIVGTFKESGGFFVSDVDPFLMPVLKTTQSSMGFNSYSRYKLTNDVPTKAAYMFAGGSPFNRTVPGASPFYAPSNLGVNGFTRIMTNMPDYSWQGIRGRLTMTL